MSKTKRGFILSWQNETLDQRLVDETWYNEAVRREISDR